MTGHPTHPTVPASSPAVADDAVVTPPRERMLVLDVVRGFALCGILVANVGPLLGVVVPWVDGAPPTTSVLEQLLVQQRFFPIFSLLFGVGFGMLWASASRRAVRPRVVLLRRLVALVLLGALHQLLQAGEALLPYAIVGTLFLLPLTFLPERARTVVAGIGGAALTVVGASYGGLMLVPGMFLLGFAAAAIDLPRRFERSARPGLVLAAVAAVVAVPAVLLQLRSPAAAGFDTVSAVAGLASGMALVGVIAALLHTPLRPLLAAVLAPLGRMALTNYVSATLVVVGAGLAFSVPPQLVRGEAALVLDDAGMAAIWGGCALLLVLQVLVARAWLARTAQGPLERLWRFATWHGEPRRVAGQ
ncbi:DUF418 domain-containing protein [Brachybacterium sp. NBEC-018]|uniref:DUF418 domain-containing protein n=1 Tax=Brachybacterium sp. NBEC-018 TaxID=2996004 RepID=UPI0021754295|nr:DUF418 domain-containing protein [Brachybacterium sp. NBEC-018]UVY84144.1 DUF418 domain-containing protein [Brachybacterium sp. NBEC-018]